MAQRINPAWTHYNDLHNEGGEGYNPHPKWITTRRELAATTAAQTRRTPASTGRLLRDLRGNLVDEAVLRSQLTANRARLATLTDPTGRAIVQRSIDHAVAQLGEETQEPTTPPAQNTRRTTEETTMDDKASTYYHITRASNAGVYGHTDTQCDAGGCAATTDRYIPGVEWHEIETGEIYEIAEDGTVLSKFEG